MKEDKSLPVDSPTNTTDMLDYSRGYEIPWERPCISREIVQAHSAEVSCIVSLSEGRFASGDCSGMIFIRNLSLKDEDKYVVQLLSSHTTEICALTFWSSENKLISGDKDGNLAIWDLSNYQCIDKIFIADLPINRILVLSDVILAVSIRFGKVKTFSIDKEYNVKNCLRGIAYFKNIVLLSENRIAVAQGNEIIIQSDRRETIRRIAVRTGTVSFLMALPDNRILSISTKESYLKIFDTLSGEQLHINYYQPGYIYNFILFKDETIVHTKKYSDLDWMDKKQNLFLFSDANDGRVLQAIMIDDMLKCYPICVMHFNQISLLALSGREVQLIQLPLPRLTANNISETLKDLSKKTTAKTLNLYRTYLSQEHLQLLFKALEKNLSIETVILERCSLDDEKIKILAPALISKKNSIREVFLKDNKISRSGAKRLLNQIDKSTTLHLDESFSKNNQEVIKDDLSSMSDDQCQLLESMCHYPTNTKAVFDIAGIGKNANVVVGENASLNINIGNVACDTSRKELRALLYEFIYIDHEKYNAVVSPNSIPSLKRLNATFFRDLLAENRIDKAYLNHAATDSITSASEIRDMLYNSAIWFLDRYKAEQEQKQENANLPVTREGEAPLFLYSLTYLTMALYFFSKNKRNADLILLKKKKMAQQKMKDCMGMLDNLSKLAFGTLIIHNSPLPLIKLAYDYFQEVDDLSKDRLGAKLFLEKYTEPSVLHLTIKQKQFHLTKFFIEKNFDINLGAFGNNRNTLLHMACESGELETFNLLLSTAFFLDNRQLNLLNHEGLSPLMLAIRGGHYAIAKTILLLPKFSSGIKLASILKDDDRNEKTMLLFTIESKNFEKPKDQDEICQLLLCNGVKPHYGNSKAQYQRALMTAIEHGLTITCQQLIRRGPEWIHEDFNKSKESGNNAFYLDLLLKAWWNKISNTSCGTRISNPWIMDAYADLASFLIDHYKTEVLNAAIGSSEKNAISRFVAFGNTDLIEKLLRKEVAYLDTDGVNGIKSLPIHVAAQSPDNFFDAVEVIKCLLNWEKQYNDNKLTQLSVKTLDQLGYSALHVAASVGNHSVLAVLLSTYECDPNIEDSNGNTALHVLALNSNLDHYSNESDFYSCARFLRLHGVDVSKRNRDSATAFDLIDSLKNPMCSVAELLMDFCVRPDPFTIFPELQTSDSHKKILNENFCGNLPTFPFSFEMTNSVFFKPQCDDTSFEQDSDNSLIHFTEDEMRYLHGGDTDSSQLWQNHMNNLTEWFDGAEISRETLLNIHNYLQTMFEKSNCPDSLAVKLKMLIERCRVSEEVSSEPVARSGHSFFG